jgi:YfiH family protein
MQWRKNDGFYTLDGLKGALMAFSTRKFYPAFKEDLDYMVSERKKFLKALGLDIENLVCPKQVHEAESFRVFSSDKGKGAFGFDETVQDTDILFTNDPEVILSVLCADCLALFIFDPVKRVIAISHVGWRGLAKGIVEATLNKLRQSFSCEPKDLIVGLGPAIRSCCYEIAAPAANYFSKFIEKRGQRQFLNIPEVVKTQLKGSGVAEKSIFDANICTSCSNTEFFSYRRESDEADRIMAVICLK